MTIIPVTLALECFVMSESLKPFQKFMVAVIADQMRRGLTTGGVLNINAMDELDPVHYRASKNPAGEYDYDGDMGREHSEYLRDNGIGGRQLSVGTFIPIGAALPVIEAPSIVAEHPATEPVKTESEG